jgi:hypothetical protein
MSDTLHVYTDLVAHNHKERIEQWVRMRIKPCPKWMPKSFYERMLKELIVLEYFDKPLGDE